MFFPPAWPDGEYEAIAVTTVQSRGKNTKSAIPSRTKSTVSGDSTRTMIVVKFYHFHHHRGITLNADPFINLCVQSISIGSQESEIWSIWWEILHWSFITYFSSSINYRIKFTWKNQCKYGHFYCMFICENILTSSGKKITSNSYTNTHF